jgi:hypothetical protein
MFIGEQKTIVFSHDRIEEALILFYVLRISQKVQNYLPYPTRAVPHFHFFFLAFIFKAQNILTSFILYCGWGQ